MNVVVMVFGPGTGFIAKGVFKTSFIIEDLMNETLIQKGLQGSIDSDSI
jgi:hypothetical protein